MTFHVFSRTFPCIFLVVWFCLCACKDKKAGSLAIVPVVSKDSIANKTDSLDDEKGPRFNYDRYEQKKHLETKKFIVDIKRGYYLADTVRDPRRFYPDEDLLIVRNKATNKSDTVKLEGYNSLSDDEITDYSDSLHFSLCLGIDWIGDSDMPMTELVGYWRDTLRSIVVIGNLLSIHRKNEWMLSGFTMGRDEIVSMGEDDYPFEFSLKDYSMKDDPPPVQYIGHSTVTMESVKGYKMINKKDSVAYTIKKGVEVFVDTFYRAAGRVILLILPDSTHFHTTYDKVQFKLKSDDAG